MSFYPPGWDYNRVWNLTTEDFTSLTHAQHATLFTGLKEAGLFDDLVAEWKRRDLERVAVLEASKSEEERLAEREIRAPYIDTLNQVFKFQEEWSEWGFVVFRVSGYGEAHDDRWEKFRRRWEVIFQEAFEEWRGWHPKSDRAIELVRFRWVEDEALGRADFAEVSHRYDELWRDLPRGFSTSACLMVTESVIDSVLNSPLPSSAPQKDRSSLSYVVAVSQAAHIPLPSLTPEEELEIDPEILNFKGYFKVAVQSLLDSFYPIVALDIMDLHRLAGRMKDERDIWCHPHRGGVRFYGEGVEKGR
ncbi:hypothetical protein BDV12DRAFT_20107 [Aspergillus spectabilis]